MKKMKIVNLCGSKYIHCGGDWGVMYVHVMNAFHRLGYEVRVSPFLNFYETKIPSFVKVGIEDNPEHVYVYNHTYIEELHEYGNFLGRKTLFIKPTGPGPECFTIDPEGFAGASSITDKKPELSNVRAGEFFNTTATNIIKSKKHKWSNRNDIKLEAELTQDLPENYTLIFGQMPHDSTVVDISFGDHWKKLTQVTKKLLECSKYPVVLKLHPCLLAESTEEDLTRYLKDIALLEERGATVLQDAINVHDILPKARVVLVENSTAGIEALLHQKPVISFGYPEYHWVTKDLRHLHKVSGFVENLSWYNKENSNKWVCWYYEDYLCKTEEETYLSVKKYLEP